MKIVMPQYENAMVPFNIYEPVRVKIRICCSSHLTEMKKKNHANLFPLQALNDHKSLTSWFIPQHPMLTMLIFHAILTHIEPNAVDDWVFVFGLTYDPSSMSAHPAYVGVQTSKIFAGLLGGSDKGSQEGIVLDFWSIFEAQASPDAAEEGRWWKHFASIAASKSDSTPENGKDHPFAYTLDDFSRMFEFVEAYYKAQVGGQPPPNLPQSPESSSIKPSGSQSSTGKSYSATMEDASDSDSEKAEKHADAATLLPTLMERLEGRKPSANQSSAGWSADDDAYYRTPTTRQKGKLEQAASVVAVVVALMASLWIMGVFDFAYATSDGSSKTEL